MEDMTDFSTTMEDIRDEIAEEESLMTPGIQKLILAVEEKYTAADDIKRKVRELEDQAIRDSLLGDYKKAMVDYTWEEMLEMLRKDQADNQGDRGPLSWRVDPFEYIKDLMKPEFNINVPEPAVIDYYPEEPLDESTDSDEPEKPKPRVYPYRLRHKDLNKYSREYWLAREQVRNLRIGNDLAVITTLSLMLDNDYKNEEVSYGIVDSGGVETLLNFAVINYITIQIGALKILRKLADHQVIKRLMMNQGLAQFCFRLLPHYDYDVVICVSEILLQLSDIFGFRPLVRKSSGLEIMLEIAELPDKFYSLPEQTFKDPIDNKKYIAGKNCLLAIKNAHRSKLVRDALYRLGFVRLLRKLIGSANAFFKQKGNEFLYEASGCMLYQQIFVLDGFMKHMVAEYKKCGNNTPEAIMMLKGIYKSLKYETCRNYALDHGVVKYIIDQIRTLGPRKQLKYALGTVVGFLKLKKYRSYLNKRNVLPVLLQLFKHHNKRMRNYAGTIAAELSRYRMNHDTLVGEQNLGLTWLFEMCQSLLDYDLLAHVYKIVMELSYIPSIFWWVADKLEVVPLLWAGVTNPHPRCNEYGCSALVPYIGPLPDSQDQVRRISGSFFDALTLTYSEDEGAQAGVITLLSRVANDTENLNILECLGFIDRLFQLAKTAKHPRLKYAIGLAFGSVGHVTDRSFDLGKRGAVNILVEWLLNDDDPYEQLGVITGLWKLSYEKINCMCIIKCQIVERLMEIMATDNECLHNSIAGLLTNLRALAREAEIWKNMDEPVEHDPIEGTIEDADLVMPYQYPDEEEPVIHID